MQNIVNISTYKFVPLGDLRMLKARLLALCRGWELKGTILLSVEGINLFVAGTGEKIDSLLAELRSWPGLSDLNPKVSQTDHQPFNRMLVRVKKEIIAFGVAGINPARQTSPKLPPRTLKQWLDEGRPVRLLDARNDYEVKLGTFNNALPIGVENFRDFPDAVRRLPPGMKEEAVVMFCTGGIRCEKAGPFMEREGFKNVFQLDGGILKYFEECGGAHYQGECFVFDQRVGLDPTLQETDTSQCFRCLTPLTAAEQQDPRYRPGHSCPYCHQSEAEARALLLDQRHQAIRQSVNPLPGSIAADQFKPVNIPEECDGQTLVEALCRIVRHLPAGHWEAKCLRGLIVDENLSPVAASHRVRAGERYRHKIPLVVEPPVNGGVQILHEDEALIVVNKPAPLPMHAGGRFYRNTLQQIIHQVYHPQKPRPAHRLDANTTGLVLFTRTRFFAGRLQPQFAEGRVKKTYLARVQGHPVENMFRCRESISTESGELGSRTVDSENGRLSETEFEVLHRFEDGTSLLKVNPLTGRTNQIRIHLWHLGYPICGDQAYLAGQKMGVTQTLELSDPPLCLHAWKISFIHPLTREPAGFTSPEPSWVGIKIE